MTDRTSKDVTQRLIEALNLAMKHVRCDRDCGSSSYRDGIRSCGCGKAQDSRLLFSLFTDDDWKLIRAGQSPDETEARRESWSLHVWENDGGYYRCQICETMSLEAHTAKLCPGRRSNATEPPYRVRAFWSPCRKYIASVCVSEGNITLIDDDGRIWEPTGPEQDMTKQSAQKSVCEPSVPPASPTEQASLNPSSSAGGAVSGDKP